jgi:signal transduction histidine kinase
MNKTTTPSNLRVLIVDDTPPIHNDFMKILSPEEKESSALDLAEAVLFGAKEEHKHATKFAVESAFQGDEAIALVKKSLEEGRPFAVAFVDVRMPPGLDGIETVSQLWQVDPELQVVICSAYSDYTWEQITEKIGKSDSLVILKKPFDNIEVLQLAHALTEKWRLRRDLNERLNNLDELVQKSTKEANEANERLRQSQKMEAIGQLAAGVAHDFNNMLTIILGHASMQLSTNKLDRKTSEALEQVKAAGERATTLTRQLLAFSRRQIMQRRPVDLNILIAQLSKMLKRLIGEHIDFLWDENPDLPFIFADPGNIEQVLMNLVVNARDAMPEGGKLALATNMVEVDESFPGKDPEVGSGQFVRLSVSDTGCGMSEETQKRIFEPFFTTKAEGKGTGMGLATVYGIVKQHGGWVAIRSELGKGSTFEVYLPASSERHAAANTPASPINGKVVQGNESILVVEDEDSIQLLAQSVLEGYGYRVAVASDGAQALEVWKKNGGKFDLLLTDMVMPGGMTGAELAQRLVEENPQLRVVYTTGYSLDVLREKSGFAAGDNVHFLQKPYPAETLGHIVRQCLDEVPRNATPDLVPVG